MSEFFTNIPKVEFEGPTSTNKYAFKFYDAEREILGKPMKEHLKFSLAWWHAMNGDGKDIFGDPTIKKDYGAGEVGTMKHALARVDAAFEIMQKLGMEYFCFHDVDIAPQGKTLAETNKNLDEVTDYMLEKMQETGIKLLWGTTNLFNDPIFMNGAGTANSADVFAYAATKVKKSIELTVKLGGSGYVFWGGREGYETLLNTDVALEQDNMARFMKMAIEYARSIGYKGDFYIEPKAQEPMKHQYDFDAATAIQFIQKYNLQDDVFLNIEANHATLAGHTFEHELRIANINNAFGSVDANQGDPLLGWDTDSFPSDVYATTLGMLEVLRAGGFTNGGLNFDSKNRRASNTYEDIFLGFVLGMDAFALGLIKAARIIEDGRIDEFVKERYSSFSKGIGKKIVDGETNLVELAEYIEGLDEFENPGSGRQEYLEAVLNQILFTQE